jgi:hypothetical protein
MHQAKPAIHQVEGEEIILQKVNKGWIKSLLVIKTLTVIFFNVLPANSLPLHNTQSTALLISPHLPFPG